MIVKWNFCEIVLHFKHEYLRSRASRCLSLSSPSSSSSSDRFSNYSTLFKNAKSPVLRCPSLPYVGNSSFHVAMLKTVKGRDFGGRNKKLGIYFQFLAKLLQKPYIYDFRIYRWHYLQTFIPMRFLVYFM